MIYPVFHLLPYLPIVDCRSQEKEGQPGEYAIISVYLQRGHSMPSRTGTAEKILNRLKGLRNNLQADEQPLFSMPAIWDGGQGQHATPCDIVVTNLRVFGYFYVSFPRERLFLDALPLKSIRAISLRQKSFEPIFRELLVSSDQRRVYIRAPRQKIESLYEALRSAIQQYTPATQPIQEPEEEQQTASSATATTSTKPTAPVYGKQEIRGPFERSPLAIILLFVGGLLLEIAGAYLWFITQNPQGGFPLCVAGFVSVVTAFLIVRSRG